MANFLNFLSIWGLLFEFQYRTENFCGYINSGDDFVVVSAEDWEREQETLYVLQNSSLMKQIAASSDSHAKNKGYRPTIEELDEIADI